MYVQNLHCELFTFSKLLEVDFSEKIMKYVYTLITLSTYLFF